MELYKATVDGVIFHKSPKTISGEDFVKYVKKGELLLVKSIEELESKEIVLKYKKFNLLNGNYTVSINQGLEQPFVEAGFSDIPEHLFIQIKKPKVYITLGVILLGLTIYSIIKERQNN